MNEFLTEGAWELEHSSKIDVLEQPQHDHLILRFLGDKETGIERNPDSTYILYGKEEAVLVMPTQTTTKLLLFFVYKLKRLFNSNG